jgi:hypothetical protein
MWQLCGYTTKLVYGCLKLNSAASGLMLYSWGTGNTENTGLPLHGADHTENTSHMIATKLVYGCTDYCPAISCNIPPLRQGFHCCAFTKPLPGNVLIKSITILYIIYKWKLEDRLVVMYFNHFWILWMSVVSFLPSPSMESSTVILCFQ